MAKSLRTYKMNFSYGMAYSVKKQRNSREKRREEKKRVEKR